jgi:conjugal transfer pilus assembly protein TraW
MRHGDNLPVRSLLLSACVLPALWLSLPAAARDLGTRGDLYPVAEQDMLVFIQQQLHAMQADGTLAQMQAATEKRIAAHVLRPTPVPGLHRAVKAAVDDIDPSVTVDHDIADSHGVVFARRGERINPLTYVAFRETLYFIDGDDKAQVAWMAQQTPETLASKIILVNGDIKTTGEALNAQMYFDQNGVLTRKLHITALPARVTLAPDGQHLRVTTSVVTGATS